MFRIYSQELTILLLLLKKLKEYNPKKKKAISLRAWGHNNYGQLGIGNLEQNIFTQNEVTFFRNKKNNIDIWWRCFYLNIMRRK